MRILHVASFLGNIGDNFNHLGTRKLLEEKLGKIEWSEIEIRETFRKKYAFDEKFADYCNTFDAVIFEDYDKGNITPAIIDSVVKIANSKNIPTLVDPKKRNFDFYKGVTLFKPNFKEICEGSKEDIPKGDFEAPPFYDNSIFNCSKSDELEPLF